MITIKNFDMRAASLINTPHRCYRPIESGPLETMTSKGEPMMRRVTCERDREGWIRITWVGAVSMSVNWVPQEEDEFEEMGGCWG